MFERSARYYDAIYSFKDYRAEAEEVHGLIQRFAPQARSLLDVGCGTGLHLMHLKRHYEVAGLDLDQNLLDIAKERLPSVELHRADMVDFDLGRRFDAVTCLFSSIGYVTDEQAMRRAIASMAAHLNDPGVLVVEGWIKPEDWDPKGAAVHQGEYDGKKVIRMMNGQLDGDVSTLWAHYLVETDNGSIEHLVEEHRLGLYTAEQYLTAFEEASLAAQVDDEALMGRGVYIGVKEGSPTEMGYGR